ncbi:MAG: NUDIX hydrolase [Anaerolineales bacterium]|nr:NUDIX hydrolase [Anaerolineales bacterium]MCB9128174.1 NUDIX hydrolase [Ardenticatenales bacterium]MCB9171883.1 NUDIX hydrolase [Ardenticatenales bacterium]
MRDNALRRCTAYDGTELALPRERFVVRPSVYALLYDQDRVVLVTNRTTGRYYLPGGGVEQGESLEEALQREVREETGLSIKMGRLITAAEDFFYYGPADRAFHALQFYYLAVATSQRLVAPPARPHDEEGDPRWVSLSTLDPSAFHNHGERLCRLIRDNRPASAPNTRL